MLTLTIQPIGQRTPDGLPIVRRVPIPPEGTTVSGEQLGDDRVQERPQLVDSESGGVKEVQYYRLNSPENASTPKGEQIVDQVSIPFDAVESTWKDAKTWAIGWATVVVALAFIVWAWWQSKHESPQMRQMDEEFNKAAEEHLAESA